MKITGISINKIFNLYEVNKRKFEKTSGTVNKDAVEISELGRKLSAFAKDDFNSVSTEKLEEIKEKISKGTYKVDSKLLAQKMMESMKKSNL